MNRVGFHIEIVSRGVCYCV